MPTLKDAMCEGRREMARQVGGELGDTEKPRKQ
jgi:hypothetical protein